MSAADRKLRGLKNRKRSIVTSFSMIRSFVTTYKQEKDKCEVPVRLENLIDLWKEFNAVQTELETLEEDNDLLEAYLKERMEFEQAYYHTKGTLLQWNQPAVQSATAQSIVDAKHTNVKLPDIKLPVFSGKFEEWLNFHALFISLVHSSSSLSTIEKFYYLRSSLTGEALQLIQTIPITNDQYSLAWNLLVSHFQNPRRLKRMYVQSLFDFPIMKRETAAELQSLVDSFQTNVKILKKLGEQTEQWDVLFIYLLSSRLDSKTRRSWEEHAESQDATKFQQLVDFLLHRVNVLISVEGRSTDMVNSKKPNPLRMTSYSTTNLNLRCCPACHENHFLYQCETFSVMPIDKKEEIVERHQLCRNCFRRDHDAKFCESENRCRKCNNRHHTLLCSTALRKEMDYHPASTSYLVRCHDSNQSTSKNTIVSSQPAAHTGVTSCPSKNGLRSKVLLATASIVLFDDSGKQHLVRALLDSGSECCFVTEELAQQMQIHLQKVHLPIAGIGRTSTEVKGMIQARIKSRISNYSKTVELFVLPKVTVDVPSIPIDNSNWPIPTGIHLADPAFHLSARLT